MDRGGEIFQWKMDYWQAIAEGKDPAQAAAIASSRLRLQREVGSRMTDGRPTDSGGLAGMPG